MGECIADDGKQICCFIARHLFGQNRVEGTGTAIETSEAIASASCEVTDSSIGTINMAKIPSRPSVHTLTIGLYCSRIWIISWWTVLYRSRLLYWYGVSRSVNQCCELVFWTYCENNLDRTTPAPAAHQFATQLPMMTRKRIHISYPDPRLL